MRFTYTWYTVMHTRGTWVERFFFFLIPCFFFSIFLQDMPFDATGFDGIRIRVRGDGNRYKFRLKPDSELDATPERQYQAAFDTVEGQWVEASGVCFTCCLSVSFSSWVGFQRDFVFCSGHFGLLGGRCGEGEGERDREEQEGGVYSACAWP